MSIKRRADVVGIFANENSVLRLAAVLLGIHDEWAVAERCYLSAGCLAKLYETGRMTAQRRCKERTANSWPDHHDHR